MDTCGPVTHMPAAMKKTAIYLVESFVAVTAMMYPDPVNILRSGMTIQCG
jgi:hypothetical protein